MKCLSCGAATLDGESECPSCGTSFLDVGTHAQTKGMEKKILEGLVSDLGPKTAWSVSVSQTVQDAVDLMRAKKGGCVLILEKGELKGVFSERELLFAKQPIVTNTPIVQVMRGEAMCLRPSDSVADAFHQMAISGHRHLPGKLNTGEYGVVSSRDLLRYLCR